MSTLKAGSPGISVVIVTFGRHVWLERSILSLEKAAAAQPDLPIEILVNINGPDGSAEAVLEGLQCRLTHCELKIQRELSPRSPASARNRLLACAKHSWIYFIDDDAYVGEVFLSEFARAVSEFPDAAVIGGPNDTPPNSSRLQRASGAALASRFGTWFSSARYASRAQARRAGEEELILCNLFISREALGAERFPEDFICNEENWLLRTLADRGHPIVYAPRLVVWHERRADLAGFAAQIFAYGRGRGLNIRRRPQALRLPHLIPSGCLLAGTISLLAGGPEFPALLGFYSLLCLVSCFRIAIRMQESPGVYLMAGLLFPVIHLSYGAGVIFGLLRPGRASFLGVIFPTDHLRLSPTGRDDGRPPKH